MFTFVFLRENVYIYFKKEEAKVPLIILAIVVIVLIFMDKRKKEAIEESDDYKNWFNYYIKSGYSESDASNYALQQCRRGDKLENYGVDLKNVKKDEGAGMTLEMNARKKDSNSSVNWILGVACFCVIIGLLAMTNTIDSSLVAPLFIMVTVALFLAGSGIYSCVEILKPVGKAFITSSIIMAPFCFLSFNEILNDATISTIVMTLFSAVLSAGGAFITREESSSNFFGSLTYFWIFSFMLALSIEVIEIPEPYTFFVPCIILAYVASFFYIEKVEWLPAYFRPGAYTISILSAPILFLWLGVSLTTPDFAKEYPLFRTILAVFASVLCIWKYLRDGKSAKNAIKLRFIAQTIILAIVADMLNYSLFRLTYARRADVAIGIFAACWALSFFGQSIITLFAKHESKEDQTLETKANIAGLVGLGATLIIAHGLARGPYGVIACIVIALIAALGAFFAVKKKNIDWIFATYVSLIVLPLVLGTVVFEGWTTLITFAYFTAMSLIVTALHLVLRKFDRKKSFKLTSTVALFTSAVAAMTSMMYFDYTTIAVLVPLIVIWGLYAMESNISILFEVGIYLVGITLMLLTSDVSQSFITECPARDYSCSYRIADIQKFIQINILMVTTVITEALTGNLKKGSDENWWRLGIGYGIFTFVGTLVAFVAHVEQSNMTIGLIFLLEQAALLVIGWLLQKHWLAITSGIVLGIGSIYITGIYQYTYLWLILLGVGLIILVVWKLISANNKNGTNNS